MPEGRHCWPSSVYTEASIMLSRTVLWGETYAQEYLKKENIMSILL